MKRILAILSLAALTACGDHLGDGVEDHKRMGDLIAASTAAAVFFALVP